MAPRALHTYEAMLSGMSMGLGLTLNGAITEKKLRKAFAITRKEHPVLGTVIAMDENAKMVFKESETPTMFLDVEDPADLNEDEIHLKLMDWINIERNNNESMFYFQYFPPSPDGQNHVVLIVANHSAMDGPGVVHVFDSFCKYLGYIASGEEPPEPASRVLGDILARAKTPEGLDRPEVPEDQLPEPEGTNGGSWNGVRSVCTKLSEEMTTNLLKTCKDHGFTIQGAVCAALMLSAAKAQEHKYPLPQKISFFAPINMRSRVDPPIEYDDSVCGSSGVWWLQDVTLDHKLVDIASVATKEVHRLADGGFGLGFWDWLQNDQWMPKFTVMGTTLGVIPIQTKYGDMEVRNVLFQGGNYGAPSTNYKFMRHFYTFGGCLHISLGYTGADKLFAQYLASIDWKCLEMLAGPEADSACVKDLFDSFTE